MSRFSHVGFTGTQVGLTVAQAESLTDILRQLRKQGFRWLHHGDCIGGDSEANEIARSLTYRIHGHPPELVGKRAFCVVDRESNPRPYLVRNRDIVKVVELLIACPKEKVEQRSSGTWTTVGYARAWNVQIQFIFQ